MKKKILIISLFYFFKWIFYIIDVIRSPNRKDSNTSIDYNLNRLNLFEKKHKELEEKHKNL